MKIQGMGITRYKQNIIEVYKHPLTTIQKNTNF